MGDMDDSSSDEDEVRREERQGIAGLLREATDQTQLLAEIERLSKHITSAAHADNTKSNYEGGQARYFKWLKEEQDFDSFLMPGTIAANATIDDVSVPLSEALMKRYLVHVILSGAHSPPALYFARL